jgi:hypothetical protein
MMAKLPMQAAGNVDSTYTAALRIAGFGACMISGHPHRSGGLFEAACRFVEEDLQRPVRSNIVTLAGFPAPRSAKYLKQKVFDSEPDYIVIQFGATDASCSLRKQSRSPRKSVKSSTTLGSTTELNRPATVFTLLRWEIASVLGFLWKPQAVTDLSMYIAAIEGMVENCISAGITPVVLSPFVFGSRYTTRNAIRYADALHQLHSRIENFILVDCNRLLAKFPRRTILLKNGFHLSVSAHELIGQAIGKAIVADIKAKSASTQARWMTMPKPVSKGDTGPAHQILSSV